jgi:putative transposase
MRQTALIRQAWSGSGRIYGCRKPAFDLRGLGETMSGNRAARLASRAGIMSRDFDRQAAGLQIRAAILNCITAPGTPPTQRAG